MQLGTQRKLKCFKKQQKQCDLSENYVNVFITKLNVDAIVISANKALNGGGIDGAIHEAARPGLLDECQKLNGCETGECMVTLGYKLPAKYLPRTVRRSDKNDYMLIDCYKSYLRKVLAYNIKSV